MAGSDCIRSAAQGRFDDDFSEERSPNDERRAVVKYGSCDASTVVDGL